MLCFRLTLSKFLKEKTAYKLMYELFYRFITSVLEEFEISQHLVVGITTDNARNLISGVSILQEEQETQSLISFEEDLDGAVDSMSSGDVNMVHIRCAAHTLQLAVRDALESKKVSLDKVVYYAKEAIF